MKRIPGIDLARGLGMVGVFAAHLTPDRLTLFHGRSLALLVLVAGVTLGEKNSSQLHAVARAALLFLLGFALIVAQSSVVIVLPYLACTFILASPLQKYSARRLLAMGLAATVILPMLSFFLCFVFRIMSDHEFAAPDILDLLFSGSYPVCALLPTYLIGLGLGKLGWENRAFINWGLALALALILFGYGTSFVLLQTPEVQSRLHEAFQSSNYRIEEEAKFGPLTLDQFLNLQDGVVPPEDLVWQAVASPHSGTPFDVMGSTGVALLALLLCAALVHLPKKFHLLFSPLMALGSVSLSAYVLQVLFSRTMISEVYPQYKMEIFCVFTVAVSLGAWLWRKKWKRGPLENGMHSLVVKLAH
jgi:hypothetical protein